MKGYLQQLVADADEQNSVNIVREYLQARTLEGLMRAGAMAPLAFMGGTALRFLYYLRRYSEDLDFSLEGSRQDFDPDRWMKAVIQQFQREGYDVMHTTRPGGTVYKVLLKFSGVLHEAGASPHPSQVLMIKLEVDTKPPAGAVTQATRVNRHVPLVLRHHDKASLISGKLLAVLNREWAKGRDFYDLAWYLGDGRWPDPNFEMLNSGMRQQDPSAVRFTPENWRETVSARVAEAPWDQVAADIERFTEDTHDVLLKDELLTLLETDSQAR